jgi:predicted TIM-barrel fold metal-dependent hydrolase
MAAVQCLASTVLAMADDRFPPPGACDCHVHVIGPKARFPLARARSYTPMDAPVQELAAMLARQGIDRVVLVQPSFYGTDNACMLAAIAELGAARGVAVLPAHVTEAELADLHARGIRGLRVNVASTGAASLAAMRRDIEAAAALCEQHGWHVQIFVAAQAIEPLTPILLGLPVETVIDHFGLIAPGTETAALRALLRLLESGKVWVKISGAYRIAENPFDPAIGPLARQLCDANPERIVWGSDWPHTPKHGAAPHAGDEMPFRTMDTRALLDLVPRWFDDERLVRQVLVTNPARLYGFD